MQWYLKVLKDYVNFSGRAHRKEYWMFVLFNFIVAFGLGFIDGLIETGGVLGGLYNLAVLLPALGVSVRRLHDTNRSGWWLLISLIPIIGALVLLYFMVIEGDDGPNDYGALPPAEPSGSTGSTGSEEPAGMGQETQPVEETEGNVG